MAWREMVDDGVFDAEGHFLVGASPYNQVQIVFDSLQAVEMKANNIIDIYLFFSFDDYEVVLTSREVPDVIIQLVQIGVLSFTMTEPFTNQGD
jgi:hypothetical protein